MRVIVVLISTLVLFGCETTKYILGTSSKQIEDLRPQAKVLKVNADYNTAYNTVLNVLKEIKSYVYKKDKDMIAIYKSEDDTTAVGIFFKEIDKDNTQIEISSASTPAKEYTADKILGAFTK